MGWLLAVLIVLVAAALVVGALRTRRTTAAEPGAPRDPLADGPGGPLEGLGVGALVRHDDRDWLVRGEIAFDEDGSVWHEYHLDDVDERRWLSVETSDGTAVALWTSQDRDLDPAGRTELEWDGERYVRVEHGRARFTTSGTTGLPPAGSAEYADYRHAEDRERLLAFERFTADGTWELSIGRTLRPEALDVYPAGRAAGGTP